MASRTTRTRTSTACDACRTRRTRCDGARPPCSYCRLRSIMCEYQDAPSPAPTRVELDITAINRRLDQLLDVVTRIPTAIDPSLLFHRPVSQRDEEECFSDAERAPFRLLGSPGIMEALDLDRNLICELILLERKADLDHSESFSRFSLIQSEQAIRALAAFSERIHQWYPMFNVGFSEKYFQIICGPLLPSVSSSLGLLVAAIGSYCLYDSPVVHGLERTDGPFYKAAVGSLPAILGELSLDSIHCLILLSIYHCCLLKPCHAHDYVCMASVKIQNLLKTVELADQETQRGVDRAYWVILLLESELNVQFDAPESGIWRLDERVGFPDNRDTWHFDPHASSSSIRVVSPESNLSDCSTRNDATDAYFLAEISMRRMLRPNRLPLRRNVVMVHSRPYGGCCRRLHACLKNTSRGPELVARQTLPENAVQASPPPSLVPYHLWIPCQDVGLRQQVRMRIQGPNINTNLRVSTTQEQHVRT